MQAAGYLRVHLDAVEPCLLTPSAPEAWSDLPSHAMDAWVFDLRRPWGAEPPPKSLLSADELARADQFGTEDLRNQYVLCRAQLRMLLAGYLRATPSSLRLGVEEGGKPYVEGISEPRQLHFNLSHSGDWLLVAVAWNRRVGADIEIDRPRQPFLDIAERFFHPEEARVLRATTPEAQRARFLRCWTLKEAHAKALGVGLRMAMSGSDFSRRLDMDRPFAWTHAGQSWVAAPLVPLQGAVASVMCEEAPVR